LNPNRLTDSVRSLLSTATLTIQPEFWRHFGDGRKERLLEQAYGATMDVEHHMTPLTRITLDPDVMGGKPCIRGMRITVGTIVGLVASGRTVPEILAAYPYLEEADVREALTYAAWRVEETEVPLGK
jgi:uncharacterized protein (DUF433 family)